MPKINFVVSVTLIDGTTIVYDAEAQTSFAAVDAALATFGVCKVFAKTAA
jgi:hypothetical protein